MVSGCKRPAAGRENIPQSQQSSPKRTFPESNDVPVLYVRGLRFSGGTFVLSYTRDTAKDPFAMHRARWSWYPESRQKLRRWLSAGIPAWSHLDLTKCIQFERVLENTSGCTI